MIKPIYKGRDKDSLQSSGFRGVGLPLSSTIAKMLKYIILEWMQPTLQESGSPHFLPNSLPARCFLCWCHFCYSIGCPEVTKGRRQGFPLEKAFDTIEKAILMGCLFNKGICGRAWRVIKSWYTDVVTAVEIDGIVSHQFRLERGVRQGSVVSPTLFLIVMDEMQYRNECK